MTQGIADSSMQDCVTTIMDSNDKEVVPLTASEISDKDYYFNSYAHFGIHEEMLKDTVRTFSYRDAILQNPHLFQNKVVMDVGCGTGILSMFAAKAGAKQVFAIDCSNIANQAREIVKANGFEDTITVIQAKVEDLKLPVEKVDIIISEWMGYCLFYESMLDTVLYARDRWLAPGGLIYPDKAGLYICAIEDKEYKNEKINWWDNVYGFNMNCIKKMAIEEPLVDTVNGDQVVSDNCLMMEVDILQVTKDELSFNVPFEVKSERDDYVHAFVTFFDISFTQTHKDVYFSTSPHDHYTHWKQTVFYLSEVLMIKKGETIQGTFSCVPNEKNHRDLDISITFEFNGQVMKAQGQYEYKMR
eukprot:Nk52_evm9s246 gene=Nk52_evmTU9s246